jgi:hypothetical protein
MNGVLGFRLMDWSRRQHPRTCLGRDISGLCSVPSLEVAPRSPKGDTKDVENLKGDYGAALKRSNRWASADRDPDDPSAGWADRVLQRREFALKALKTSFAVTTRLSLF